MNTHDKIVRCRSCGYVGPCDPTCCERPDYDGATAEEAWQAAIEADRQRTNEWRKLALQFDSHRMQAIGHLKAIVDHLPDDMQSPIRNFLSAAPDQQQISCQRRYDMKELAAEIWAAAQRVPGEGIEDCENRIATILSESRQVRGEPVKCVGCEGSPSSENNPCGVCGEGVPVAWEFSHNGYWTRTSEPEMHKQMGREVRPLFTAPQPQQIPEGYKLVPIEPTEEMLECVWGRSKSVYKAMLEAAPEVKK